MFKEIKITIIPEFNLAKPIAIGDVLRLVPDPNNPYDSHCITVEREGRKAGNLANSPNTVVSGTVSATKMGERMAKSELEGAWTRIVGESVVKTSKGEDMNVLIGVCYFLPKEKATNAGKEEIKVVVGGSMVSNPRMAESIGTIRDCADAGEAMPTMYIKLDAAAKERNANLCNYVVMSPADDAMQSCGSVLTESPILDAAIAKNGYVTLNVTGVCDGDGNPIESGNPKGARLCYCGVLDLEDGIGFAIKDAMKRAVRECRSRYSDLEAKVEYMVNEAVPENIVVAAINAISVCPDDWAYLIPTPKNRFHQHGAFGELSRALAYRVNGQHLRLIGNKGSGKNTLVECIDWIMGVPEYRVQGNAEMDKTDILGSLTLKNGTLEYALSDMLKCLMVGGNVLLDEGNTVRPEVADLLHSLTDNSRSIQVPGFGLVRMHNKAIVTLTMNEGYMGTTKMNDATIDRFVPIHMECPRSIKNILTEAVPTASAKDIKTCDRVYADILAKTEAGGVDGALEPDALTIRGFCDALKVSPLIGLKNALLDSVAGKPQEEYVRNQLREVIAADCK